MTTVEIGIPRRSYRTYVGSGVLREVQRLISSLSGVQHTVVVTDERVAELHIDALTQALHAPPRVIRVPPGEQSKSLMRAAAIYDQLAESRVERRDVIVAFGGGVVCDLAGFVAATWMRGIRFIAVPTTLEAAIDAAIGGKTAVNHPTGKNLIGVFHQPVGVVIDVDLLATLGDRDYRAALAESVKHAVIRDAPFFDWHEQNADAILRREPAIVTELVARNCRIKADVVVADEREEGPRAILNYGHTIGHALEHLMEYELRHGECVGLGILVENELACRRGILATATRDRIAALLSRLGLPTRLPRPIDAAEVLACCRADKKVRRGAVNFILAGAIGTTVRVDDIRDEEVEAALGVVQPPA